MAVQAAAPLLLIVLLLERPVLALVVICPKPPFGAHSSFSLARGTPVPGLYGALPLSLA